jgi:hypothetical protein
MFESRMTKRLIKPRPVVAVSSLHGSTAFDRLRPEKLAEVWRRLYVSKGETAGRGVPRRVVD